MTNFIFMLTHHDLTVPNAIELFEAIKGTGISHVGFKDVGLPLDELKQLVSLIRKQDMKIHLEVVSESEEATIKSAEIAKELAVDYLIGGTYVEQLLKALAGTGIGCFPYIGRIVDHPCLLRGSLAEIVEDAKRIVDLGVTGINLLAYRWDGNPEELMTAVKDAVPVPLIIAGSIDSRERVRRVTELDMWAFTVGGAVFERKFVPEGDDTAQISAILAEVEEAERGDRTQ